MKIKYLLIGLLFPAFANADLVANGNFATGDYTGWNFTPASSGSDFRIGSGAGATPAATYAAYFGAVGGLDDTLTQTLATTAGQTYNVTFSLLLVTPTSGDLSVTFGSSALAFLNPGSDTWTTQSFVETATSASTLLTVAGNNGPDWNEITNISVTPATVPLPAAAWLLASGMLGLGLIMRRRFVAH